MFAKGLAARLIVAAGPSGARLVILGGATLAGPRYIWWNFVSSSRDKIEADKKNGASAIGDEVNSTCPQTIATNSFRCPIADRAIHCGTRVAR
jgi:hypothetical protein